MKECAILFIDIVDSASLGNNLSASNYQKLLEQFRVACCEGVQSYQERYQPIADRLESSLLRVQGDEFLGIFGTGTPLQQAIDAVTIAHHIKLEWLFSPGNMTRLAEGKRPLDLAAGVHRGPVQLKSRRQPNGPTSEQSYEGFAISIAKRVETHSRNGSHSRIMATEPIFRLFEKRSHIASFRYFGMAEFKGIAQSHALWELIAHTEDDRAALLEAVPQRKSVGTASVERLRAAARGEPANAWLASLLGAAEAFAGNWPEALEIAERLLRDDRFLHQPRVWRAEGLTALELWKEALQEFNLLAEVTPVNPRPYQRILCLIRTDAHDEAWKELIALEKRFGYGEYYIIKYYRSVILARRGLVQEAAAKLLSGFAPSVKNVEKQMLADALTFDDFHLLSSLRSVKEASKLPGLVAKHRAKDETLGA